MQRLLDLQLDRVLPPLGVVGVLEQLLDRDADADDPDGVGVGLAEHGTQGVDLAGGLQLGVGAQDGLVAADVLVAQNLDLLDLLGSQGGLVAEVEAQLGGVDNGALILSVKNVEESSDDLTFWSTWSPRVSLSLLSSQ
jgi:hypothetical protein